MQLSSPHSLCRAPPVFGRIGPGGGQIAGSHSHAMVRKVAKTVNPITGIAGIEHEKDDCVSIRSALAGANLKQALGALLLARVLGLRHVSLFLKLYAHSDCRRR